MKFSLVAALVVVLAAVHGAQSVSVAKRDVQAEVDKLTKMISDMSVSLTAATQDMVEKVKALEVTNAAQSYVEDGRSRVQPLVDKVQAEAARLQEQVKPFIANIEDQLKPLTDNLHAQVRPMTDMMEKIVKQVVGQIQAQLPPQ